MSKILIYSQEDLDLILELEKQENEKLQQENKQLKIQISAREEVYNRLESNWNKLNKKYENAITDYETTMFEKEQLKKQLENCYCNRTDCSGRIKDSKQYDSLVQRVENQQKEFIEYMNKTIEELECDDVGDEEMKGYLIQRINTFKEILQKYKSIIGDDKQ